MQADNILNRWRIMNNYFWSKSSIKHVEFSMLFALKLNCCTIHSWVNLAERGKLRIVVGEWMEISETMSSFPGKDFPVLQADVLVDPSSVEKHWN